MSFHAFPTFNDKNFRYRYFNKEIIFPDNSNVQFHNQEESKLNSTINANSGAHRFTRDKINSQFNKNNLAIIKIQ